MNTHKIWNDHVLRESANENKMRFAMLKAMLRFADNLSFNDELNKILRYGLFKANRVEYGTPHLIPADLVDLFPVPITKYEKKNLFQIFEEQGIKCLTKEPKFNRSESSIIEAIPRLSKTYDAIIFKLNSLDRLGHKYGPLSETVKNRIRYIDNLLKRLYGQLEDDVTLIIMSEHGMVPVGKEIDLVSFLRTKGYELGRDYLGFIGATYASFWFKDGKNKREIKDQLGLLGAGNFLSIEDRKKLGMTDIGHEYGEEIYAVKEEEVLFPEFYHKREPPKGMHGYAFAKYDSPIFLMHTDRPVECRKENIDFVDIMPTMLRLMDLPVPQYVEGKSLV